MLSVTSCPLSSPTTDQFEENIMRCFFQATSMVTAYHRKTQNEQCTKSQIQTKVSLRHHHCSNNVTNDKMALLF